MATTFQTTASFDKPSYNKGETMKLTITGGATKTEPSSTTELESVSIVLTAGDGTQTTITAGPANVVTGGTVTTQLTVSLVSVTDTASNRVWTLSADKLSATAIA